MRHDGRMADRSTRRPPSTTRRIALAAGILLAALGVTLAIVSPVRGGGPNYGSATQSATDQQTTPTVPVDDDAVGVVPKPNSGRAPEDAGDRGGSLQSLTFFLMCGAILTIGGLAWREGRRKRARLAARAAAPATTSPPAMPTGPLR
jgi:hypothetical protein